MDKNMLLDVHNLSVRYGKALAVDGASIVVEEGKVAVILGANGAGKSSFLRAISGLVSQVSGEVLFAGKRIDGMAPFAIARAGLIHVPEARRLFPYLTVLDNLKLGATTRKVKAEISGDLEKVYKTFPILQEKRQQKANSLSGGQQQMLAIARALMARPKLLILDEPCLGLAPVVINELYEVIRNIADSGVGVLLAEQNVSLALRLGTYGYVFEVGKVIFQGGIDQLRDSPEILTHAYLGA